MCRRAAVPDERSRLRASSPDRGTQSSFDAPAGSLVVFDVPGSGGYGPPAERDPARLREDLRDGYVAPEGAMRDYGVEVP